MKKLRIMVLRAVLSIFFSYIACFVFFRNTSAAGVISLAAVMMGLSYLIEFTRKREKKEG